MAAAVLIQNGCPAVLTTNEYVLPRMSVIGAFGTPLLITYDVDPELNTLNTPAGGRVEVGVAVVVTVVVGAGASTEHPLALQQHARFTVEYEAAHVVAVCAR